MPGGLYGGVGHKCQWATASLFRCPAATHYQDTTLHLNHTGVSGACLVHLKGMPRLRELQLRYTRINDQGLAHLEALTSLEEIDLTGTGVSPAAVAALRQALPRCRIKH